ncbi:MAG TPA: glycosyltransferase [Bryobacteraceae bacterium]|jgi:glycosyltransferase involved in cell wall biosynthesis
MPTEIAPIGPLVSVVTPVLNMAHTLRRAFESLKKQTGRWQHVIVDDGSTDETPRVIAAIARDPRVVHTRSTKRGIGAALNTAIDLATGDFVAFLDADDEYMPHHLSYHVAAMTEHPDVDIFWGGLEVIADTHDDMYVPNMDAGYGFISIHECVTQGTMFIRRRVFEKVRFAEDKAYCHDYDFVQRAEGKFNVRQLHEPTYRYYRNTSASVVDRLKTNWPAQRPQAQ